MMVMNKKKVINERIMPQTKAFNINSNSVNENDMIIKRQEAIDDYNFRVCGIIDERFNWIQLSGDSIVVRLHKENYIKDVAMFNGEPVFDCWISQVDGRMSQAAPPRWLDNPLPYVNTGIVVAMSPSAKARELRVKNEVEKELGIGSYSMVDIGSLVQMSHIDIATHRFYLDKQKRDFIKNPEDYMIKNWEGYVIIHPTEIEALWVDSSEFELTSPYRKYKLGIGNG